MRGRQYAFPSLVVMAVTLWTLGCGETVPTEPGGAVLGKGKPPTQSTKVTLEGLTLASPTLVIDGLAVDYTVTIVNSGKKRESATLQGEIAQGNTLHGAGGILVDCGAGPGVLSHGTCAMSFTAQASNSTGGPGTLVPGAATFVLKVLAADGSSLALAAVAVTLQ